MLKVLNSTHVAIFISLKLWSNMTDLVLMMIMLWLRDVKDNNAASTNYISNVIHALLPEYLIHQEDC